MGDHASPFLDPAAADLCIKIRAPRCARMNEAGGLVGKAAGLMGMKAVGLQNHRGTGRRNRSRAAHAAW
jgi:hypothetical protein